MEYSIQKVLSHMKKVIVGGIIENHEMIVFFRIFLMDMEKHVIIHTTFDQNIYENISCHLLRRTLCIVQNFIAILSIRRYKLPNNISQFLIFFSMRCPKCKNLDTKVIDSRGTEDGKAIRRRRECEKCGARFTSFERLEFVSFLVIKSS